MKNLAGLLFILVSSVSQAQELQTNTRLNDVGIEVFQSRKATPEVLDGQYILRTRKFKKLVELGRYAQGSRAGVWEFYDYEGKIELRYDYINQRAWFPPDPDTLRTITWADDDWRPIKLGRAPRPMGSALLAAYALTNLPKPTRNVRSWKRAEVRLFVRVDTSGTVRQINVVHPFGETWEQSFKSGLNQCVEKLAWLPGLYNGKPVDSIWEMSISATPSLTLLPK